MYTQSVLPMTRSLGALANILAKAETHCTEKGIKPEAILNFRLFPDMLPLTKQVQLTCDFAARAAARLTGAELPAFPDTETSFAELQARIKAAQSYLATFGAERFADAATREILLTVGGQEMQFDGQTFLSVYSLPQFYFHMTTAYNILRHNGVVIGKRDYMAA